MVYDILINSYLNILLQKNESEKIYRRSNSLPATKEVETQEVEEDEEENREKLFKKHGW